MPAVEFFETAEEKQWLINRLRQDKDLPIASPAKYRDAIVAEFMQKFPGTPTPKQLFKRGKPVGIETEEAASSRIALRHKVRGRPVAAFTNVDHSFP